MRAAVVSGAARRRNPSEKESDRFSESNDDELLALQQLVLKSAARYKTMRLIKMLNHSDSTTRSHGTIRRAARRSFDHGHACYAPGYCANAMFAAARTPRHFPVPNFPVPGFANRKMWDRKLTKDAVCDFLG